MSAARLGVRHQCHNRLLPETKQPGTLTRLLKLDGKYALRLLLVCLCCSLLHQVVRVPRSGKCPLGSGAEGIRTPDLLRAREALSQLSYGPAIACARSPVSVGLSGLEPETFPLSEGCSNQLS